MTANDYTPKGVARWREERGVATRSLKTGSMASDLVLATSLLGIKWPRPIEAALTEYIILATEFEGIAVARLNEARDAVKTSIQDRRAADALAVADLVRKGGIDAFGSLGEVTGDPASDIVARAAEDLAKAERTSEAIVGAAKGLLLFLEGMAQSEESYLAALDKAWQKVCVIDTSDDPKLSEIAARESLRDQAVPLIQRLAAAIEKPGRPQEDRKVERAAYKASEEWLVTPTLSRIRERERQEFADDPTALNIIKAAELKAERKAEAGESARLEAMYRTNRTDEDGVARLDEDDTPKNSEEAA